MAGGGSGRCCKIRHIVRLRQLLRRWRIRAASSSRAVAPPDVPAGHVAICVGTTYRRFVVCAAHLNHPVFRKLLAQAEEEYGFAHSGPLTVPCDEAAFEDMLLHISATSSAAFCHLGRRSFLQTDSLPLLRGLAEKSVW